MRRPIQLVVSYDGTDFGGWQRQKNARSVQEELEKALEKMHGHPVKITGAGRTDAGVHAHGQVAGFFTDIASIPAERFALALNKLLPGDVRIMSAGDAPKDFHARFDASLRRYRYFIATGDSQDATNRRYSWFVPRRPSLAILNAMAAAVVGEHDFTAFASAKDISLSRCRFIRESSFWFDGPGLVYQVSANAFLWRMVRSLVGTMIFLEPQARTPEEGAAMMEELLRSRDRTKAGPTAPAHGLFLWNVEYGERKHGHVRRMLSEEGMPAPVGIDGESRVGEEGSAAGTGSAGKRLVPGLGFIDEA